MIKLNSSDKDQIIHNSDTVVLEKDPEVKEPPMYQVILLNDDYTPMEFVVYILQFIFNHDHEKATQIMMAVHTRGKGVCGIFPKEIAEMKSHEVPSIKFSII